MNSYRQIQHNETLKHNEHVQLNLLIQQPHCSFFSSLSQRNFALTDSGCQFPSVSLYWMTSCEIVVCMLIFLHLLYSTSCYICYLNITMSCDDCRTVPNSKPSPVRWNVAFCKGYCIFLHICWLQRWSTFSSSFISNKHVQSFSLQLLHCFMEITDNFAESCLCLNRS